jgi:ketosteroid isomerase-like protein
MSQNLDLVRSIYADWERGDFKETGWADPAIEFVRADGPAPGTVWGLKATGAVWREFLADWEDFRAVAEEYREVDAERVLVLHRFSGRGRPGGAEVSDTGSRGACVFRVVDGAITKLVLYSARDRALIDLGLKE